MMPHDEIVDLLSAVMAYDNRNPSAATVAAWSKAAELGRWTLPEALDAVHAHYAEDPAFLMPAHVTERIRAARQDRAMREQHAQLEAAPADPAAAARIEQLVAEVANNLGWDRDQHRPGSAALRVRCPHCGVPEGTRCVSPSSGRALRRAASHPSRAEALAEHLREGA